MGLIRFQSGRAGRVTQRLLLEDSSASHRRSVARKLGLADRATARQIAAAFDASRLEALLGNRNLPVRARELLAEAVFCANGFSDGIALNVSSFELETDLFPDAKQSLAAAAELERHGLAFAFQTKWELTYYVPADLHPPLRAALAARVAARLKPATAQRWLGTPRQDLRDAVALWTALARTPVPVKREGAIYPRSKPRLRAALPRLGVPDPDGMLNGRRLELALAQLRDSSHLQLRMDKRHGYDIKGKLTAAGDLADTLSGDAAAFKRFPYEDYEHRGQVVCARALSGALAGRSVSLTSIGRAMQTLGAAHHFMPHQWTPAQLALSGLLPGWLRGELQLGLTQRGKLTTVRFVAAEPVPGERPQHTEHAIADWCRALARPARAGGRKPAAGSDHEPDIPDDQDRLRRYLHPGPIAWSPHKPFEAGQPEGIQISTLDCRLHLDPRMLPASPDLELAGL